jgi:hypothetical protein
MKYLTEKRIALGLNASATEYSEYDEDDEPIPAESDDSTEESHPNTIASAMEWAAILRREECKIVRHGVDSILITHIPTGCAFRLKEATKTFMAF